MDAYFSLEKTAAMSYYSVIQYMPDRLRAEGANVGVLILTEGVGVKVKVDPHCFRALQFFGIERRRWAAEITASMEDRLRNEDFKTKAEVDHFIATRANDIQFTPLRFCSHDDLDDLYRRAVE